MFTVFLCVVRQVIWNENRWNVYKWWIGWQQKVESGFFLFRFYWNNEVDGRTREMALYQIFRNISRDTVWQARDTNHCCNKIRNAFQIHMPCYVLDNTIFLLFTESWFVSTKSSYICLYNMLVFRFIVWGAHKKSALWIIRHLSLFSPWNKFMGVEWPCMRIYLLAIQYIAIRAYRMACYKDEYENVFLFLLFSWFAFTFFPLLLTCYRMCIVI